MKAVIVDAVRTCVGARAGALRSWHAADLLGFSYVALARRTELDPRKLDGVIAACRTTVGEQALNVARSAVLASGWPYQISAITVEGSTAAGISALQSAVGLIASGASNAIVVSGVEVASRVPAGASTGTAVGKPYGPKVHERFAPDGGLLPPGRVAERLARRFEIDRDAMDSWVESSRQRAYAHQNSGSAKGFVLPVPLRADRVADLHPWQHVDELVDAWSITSDNVRSLKPMFEVDGLVTAANMAQPADGSAAMLITSEEFAGVNGLQTLATIEDVAVKGAHVLDGDSGSAVAMQICHFLQELEFIEVHEDFACSPLAFIADTKVDKAVVNQTGGALARGDTGGAAAISLLVEAAHRVNAQSNSGLVVVAGAGDLAAAAYLDAR